MNHITITINNIPSKIKERIIKHFFKKISLVGYKKISTQCKIPVIEFSNKTRIWVLKHEIENPTTV
uniref:Cytochrome b6-f complex subunit PetP n=1 Tax=Chondria sp. (in: red algae) TaxID=1982705 RepID=A0A1Z1MCR8_9FLOR|nr:cytochrome b6-f complex subunit PetP [Chondria sp. (in: red algae)]